MSIFLVLFYCWGVYGGGGNDDTGNVPVWNNNGNNNNNNNGNGNNNNGNGNNNNGNGNNNNGNGNNKNNNGNGNNNNNNVVYVPIWTDVAVTATASSVRPVPIPVYRDPQPSYATPSRLPNQQSAYSSPVLPPSNQQAYSTPSRLPSSNQQGYSVPPPQAPTQQAYSTPVVPVPVYHDPIPPAYSTPVTRQAPPSGVVPVSGYSTPLSPTPYDSTYVLPSPTPQVVQVPIWTDPRPTPSNTPVSPPITISVPIWTDPRPTPLNTPAGPPITIPIPIWTDSHPTPSTNPVPSPTPLTVLVPVWTDPRPTPSNAPISPTSVSSPTSITITVPIWTDPRPTPSTFPAFPTQPTSLGSPTQQAPTSRNPAIVIPVLVPTPASFPFPDPPTNTVPTNRVPASFPFPDPPTNPALVPTNAALVPTNAALMPTNAVPTFAVSPPSRQRIPPTTVGPWPQAPTSPTASTPWNSPTRARRTRAPTPWSAVLVPRAEVTSVSPASVCSTVRRNLKITGSGFLSSPANFTCEVVPSCDDNMDWRDANGNVCAAYDGKLCDADAVANCRKSCRVECPRAACQDQDEFFGQCTSFAAQGKCVSDANSMMLKCPVTCNYCGLFPAFVLNDTMLACQAPPLGGQGSVTLQVWSLGQGKLESDPVGAFRVQSYDCQNNETSDPLAVKTKDLAALAARPVPGGFGPNDLAMAMQFYVENIGLLDLAGPVVIHLQAGSTPARRLLSDQAIWCAPSLAIGMLVSCTVVRNISAEERAAKSLVTSVWVEAMYQNSNVNSSVYTFRTNANAPTPTAAPGTTTSFINGQSRAAASHTCFWTDSASCWPWWAWLILALLLLLLITCCIAGWCAFCKRNRDTSKNGNNSFVYRQPRPKPSPPVVHPSPSPSPQISQEVAHGPSSEVDHGAQLAYRTMEQDNAATLEGPAVRLLFNTGSGPFEVRGPEPEALPEARYSEVEAPSHFVFEDRASVSHSPTAGRRSISYSLQNRRDTRDHVFFNEAT